MFICTEIRALFIFMIKSITSPLLRGDFAIVKTAQMLRLILLGYVQVVKNLKNSNIACIFIQNMVLFMQRKTLKMHIMHTEG